MPFDLQPVLTGDTIELRPLREEDFPALYAVASDPLIWEQHPDPDRWTEPVFREFFRGAMESGGALVVLDRNDGRFIGSSRFAGYDEAKSEIEIGWTFLARSHWAELLLSVRRQPVGLTSHHATVGGDRRLCFQALDQFVMFVAAIVCRHDDDVGIVVERKSTSAIQGGLLAAAAVERLSSARDAQMSNISQQHSRRAAHYPLASIAPYGPDDTFAMKLVVSVLERPGQREPSTMRTWTTQAVDVRHDPTIAAGVADFLREYGVKHTVTSDRIMGCPHQEGIDYPMGRSCPRCPFWAGIDRFTHEPRRVPAPTLSPSEILTTLSRDPSVQPAEALASAESHREALIEPLLSALERGIANPASASIQEGNLFSYALYLLAKWREPRAYPYVIRWLSLPEEKPFEVGGDIVTQDGARILAAVCDGDLTPIKRLILNRDADQYGRGAGVSALALLAAWAEIPREPVVEYFLWLAEEGLEREPSQVWDSLVAESADIEALVVFPALGRAYRDGLADPQSMAPEELAEVESAPPGRMLEAMRERQPPIDDVAIATSWWSAFENKSAHDALEEAWDDERQLIEPAQPYRAPAKVGRNEPCPCGSGKKFKKCCGR